MKIWSEGVLERAVPIRNKSCKGPCKTQMSSKPGGIFSFGEEDELFWQHYPQRGVKLEKNLAAKSEHRKWSLFGYLGAGCVSLCLLAQYRGLTQLQLLSPFCPQAGAMREHMKDYLIFKIPDCLFQFHLCPYCLYQICIWKEISWALSLQIMIAVTVNLQ